jgi:hypothetical protein
MAPVRGFDSDAEMAIQKRDDMGDCLRLGLVHLVFAVGSA